MHIPTTKKCNYRKEGKQEGEEEEGQGLDSRPHNRVTIWRTCHEQCHQIVSKGKIILKIFFACFSWTTCIFLSCPQSTWCNDVSGALKGVQRQHLVQGSWDEGKKKEIPKCNFGVPFQNKSFHDFWTYVSTYLLSLFHIAGQWDRTHPR